LHVADQATALWQKTEDELGAIGLAPPFWAFAWAGGQALARHVLDYPALVAGHHVLDFASGSGLVAIAAAKAGAARVEAADIDGFALAAMDLNARANHVRIESVGTDQIGTDRGWHTVLAGDICYERNLAERVMTWLAGLADVPADPRGHGRRSDLRDGVQPDRGPPLRRPEQTRPRRPPGLGWSRDPRGALPRGSLRFR
jgi:predicted nicotinamide N-methyase